MPAFTINQLSPGNPPILDNYVQATHAYKRLTTRQPTHIRELSTSNPDMLQNYLVLTHQYYQIITR